MFLLVCIAGIALAIMHRNKAPQAFTIAIVSLSVLLLVSLADFIVEPIIYKLFGSTQGGGLTVSNLLKFWRIFVGLINAVGTGGLVIALFCDRGIKLSELITPNTKKSDSNITA